MVIHDYVNPANFIIQYSQYSDYHDSTYAASLDLIPFSVIKRNIPKEELWVSGIETEEKILDQTQRIISRRLSNTSQKNKYKKKSK